MALIIAVIVIAIFYVLFKQNFTVYTSGATQRYASEFSSTSQGPEILSKLAFNPFTEQEGFSAMKFNL